MKPVTGHAAMLCSYTAQVHTVKRTASAGFVCVHFRNSAPPSLGFPLTLQLHFLLLNSFFPTAPQRKWKLLRRGQISLLVPTGCKVLLCLFHKVKLLEMLQ